MDLVVLAGLPGVGKLTVGRALADVTGYRLFHNHLTVDLVLSLFEFGSQPFVELREEVWLAAIDQAVGANLGGVIFTLAYDHTVRDRFVDQIQEIVEVTGGTVRFVELTCNREELERRLVLPSRAEFGKLRSVKQLRSLYQIGAFDGPQLPPDRLLVETTGRSADEVAGQIVNELSISTTNGG